MKRTKFFLKKTVILLSAVMLGLLFSCSSSEDNNNEGDSSSGSDKKSSSSVGSSSGSGDNSSGSADNSSSSTIGSSSGSVISSSSSFVPSDECRDYIESGGSMPVYEPAYGSPLTDNRDGKTYKTVIIGNEDWGYQTWMAENLNFKPNGGMSKCYAEGRGLGQDDWLEPEAAQAYCEKYGRLYDWETARTACPSGWHLPDTSEWKKLINFIIEDAHQNYEDCFGFGIDKYVGTKLKAATGWEAHDADLQNMTNAYGFSAIAGGYCVSWNRLSDGGGYFTGTKCPECKTYNIGIESNAHWWSSTTYVNQYNGDNTQAYKYSVSYSDNLIVQRRENKIDYLYSVRCVKD